MKQAGYLYNQARRLGQAREGRASKPRGRSPSAASGGAGRERRRALTMPRWEEPEELIEQAGLGIAPPYRPQPGEAVYHIRAGELTVQAAEQDLTGPLQELVTAVLAEGADG